MNFLDRAIGFVAPQAGLRRARHRAAIATLARSYEGARVGRRTEGWVVAATSANAEIGTALVRLRDRSRDLVRNNPYAAKAVSVGSATWSAPASCRAPARPMPSPTRRQIRFGRASPRPVTPISSPISPACRR